MFFRHYIFCFLFRYACLSITLLAFISTSMIPLHATLDEDISKGVIGNLNPTKKIEKIKAYMKQLESFNSETSFKDLSSFMKSFKDFTEKEIGRKISIDDLFYEVNKQIPQQCLAVG